MASDGGFRMASDMAVDSVPPHVGHVSKQALGWFESKLMEERLRITKLHKSWVEELEAYLDTAAKGFVADDGAVTDLSQITPAADKIPGDAAMALAVPGDAPIIAPTPSIRPPSLGGEVDLTGSDFFARLVLNRKFDIGFGLLIIANMAVMAVEAQYTGIGVGYDIGFPSYAAPKTSVWKGADSVLAVIDLVFGVMYTIELIMKIIGLRLRFIDAWNLLDLFIVVMWYVDLLFSGVALPIDTMLLRLMRLIKLLRLLKLARTLAGFQQVFLMITALKGSATMLFWASVLLTATLSTVSLLMNQVLVSYVIVKGASSDQVKHECFMYFGTFSRSLFSMYELTMGNWVPIGRFLIESVSEWFVIFSIIFKLTLGFAVISVINGCFIKETFKVADHDDLLMIMQKDAERKVHYEKMMKLLATADATGDGTLTKTEFEEVCLVPDVNKWLAAQGLRVADAPELFELLDDGGGLLSKEELIAGVNQLKGFARSLDLALLMKDQKLRTKKIEQILDTLMGTESRLSDGQQVLVQGQATLVDRLQAAPLSQQTAATVDYSEQFAKLARDIAEINGKLNKSSMAMANGIPPFQPAFRAQDSGTGKPMNGMCS